MCGIVGYVGTEKNAVYKALNALKNLEYRGYDSSGVALFENDKIQIYKEVGKIKNLEESLESNKISSNISIAHTRWATHGKPSSENAHPHRVGKVTLVHNGIIENYSELKELLEKEGILFKTTTDTEVACSYIDYMYKKYNSKLEAIQKACNDFRGSYSFAILFDDDTKHIYATRKDSPLVIGISELENFITSDISAMLDYTRKYVELKNGEFAVLSKNEVLTYDITLSPVSKNIETATWDAAKYKKDGYDHFMLKEIHEQPKVISNIFKSYMNKKDCYDINFLDYSNIDIVACGSAMHAGLVGKCLFESYANIPVNVEIASEYRYKNQLITSDTLVIIVSQSGETADSIAALKVAKEKGATVLAIVNAIGSTISKLADTVMYTYAGPEIAVATTKGYTTQVAVLSTLVMHAMEQKNLLSNEMKKNIYTEFENVESLLNDIINRNEEFKNIANKLYLHDNIFFIGRGIDYSICMEGSLKLKEISYIHSEAYPAGELKHGTISLIEEGTPVISIATNENIFEKTVSNALETQARGAFLIYISTKNTLKNKFADLNLLLPDVSEFVQPLLVAIALQLISYNTAKSKGCDIDKPKNLAKSVTVE